MAHWLHKASGQQPKDLGGFSIILADPCWQYGDTGTRGGTDHHYETLSVAQLKSLPVWELAAPDCTLFLWTCCPLLPEALDVAAAWGFKFKNKAFAWVKRNPKAGTVFVGPGHWTRGNTEDCYLFTRGKPKRSDAGVSQVVQDVEHARDCPVQHSASADCVPGFECETLDAPRGRHSAKPPEVRERIARLMGADLPAIELFAREHVPGWECWGNEVEETVSLIGWAP